MDLPIALILVIILFVTSTFSDNFDCEDFYYGDDITDNGQVVFICTNSYVSSSSNYNHTVYLDTARVPLSVNSRCYCNLTFEHQNPNQLSYRLDVKLNVDGFNDQNNLTVTGPGANYYSTSRDDSEERANISPQSQNNPIVFTVHKTVGSDFKACLRIRQRKPPSRGFAVHCYTNDRTLTTNEYSSTNTDPPVTTSRISGSSVTTSSTGGLPNNPLPTPALVGSQDDTGPGLGTIIGGAVGGAVVVILAVVVVIIVIKKRKEIPSKDNEDYYVTENAMYHGMNGPATTEQHADNYDTIASTHNDTDTATYSVVNKNIRTPNTAPSTEHDIDNEYNHLNEVTHAFSTGNVYSTAGNEYSSTGNGYPSTGNEYSSTGNSDDQSVDSVYNSASVQGYRKGNTKKPTDNDYN